MADSHSIRAQRAAQKNRQRQLRKQKRLAAGLCERCGKLPHREGIASCGQCRSRGKENAYNQQVRHQRKTDGLCPHCGKRPPREGRKLCAECVQKQCAYASQPDKVAERKVYDAERRRKFLDAGLCFRCGKYPPRDGITTCEQCRGRDSATVRKSARRVQEERRREGRLSYSGEQNRILRAEALVRYGGQCVLCGETEPVFLTIDHINGGGNQHRRSVGRNFGSGGFIRWLRRQGWPEGYRTLCFNCNIGGEIRARRARAKPGGTSIYRLRIKIEAMNAYGGLRCVCCGCQDEPCLTIDHVNGDGAAHRKQIGIGVGLYYWLRRNGWPAGHQVMCFNCNCAKRNGATCPHALIREGVTGGDDRQEKMVGCI